MWNSRVTARWMAPIALILALSACVSAATATPTPTATPSPTPGELLMRAADALRGLESVRFELTHEEGGTQMGGGFLVTAVEGQAAFPDRATLDAHAVSSTFGIAVDLGIVQIGSKAYLRDPLSGTWRVVDLSELPFLFAGVNVSVVDALVDAVEVSFVGTRDLDGVPVFALKATVSTEVLKELVPSAQVGERLSVEVLMGQEDGLVRSFRVEGALLAQDTTEMVRVLRLSEFNVAITIEPPL